jgi:simple sugar transport system permease protein
VLLFFVGFAVPGFLSARNILNVMWAAAPLGCMVLGLFFVVLTANVDLSLESTFALAPTLAIVICFQWLPLQDFSFLAVIATLLVGAGIGLANGLFSVKLRVSSFLVTLGALLFMRGIVVYLIPEGVYYLPDGYIYLGSAKIFGILPVSVLVWIAVFIMGWLLVDYHRLGKDILALGNNEEAAFIAGVNIDRTKILCFVIAGALAALGGLLEVGRLQSVVADMGQGDILMVFAGTILGGTALTGGKGNVGGVFAAVLVIAIIENLMNLFGVPPSIRQVVFGAVLLVAIYLASLQESLRQARMES